MNFTKRLLFTASLAVFACFKTKAKDTLAVPGINPGKVMVTTFAGVPGTHGHVDGHADVATFDSPRQLILDTRPNPGYTNGVLFVADQGYNGLVIRAIDPVTGHVSTYVDKGVLYSIGDIILDTRNKEGGSLLITDTRMNKVYQVRRNADGKGDLTLVAGFNGDGDMDGDLSVAQLSGPTGLAIDKAGKIYVFSKYFKTLKKIDLEAGTMSKFAGHSSPLGVNLQPTGGMGVNARLNGNISDLALSADGRSICFADWDGQSLYTVDIADAKVTIRIPRRSSGYQSGAFSGIALYYPELVAAASNGKLFYSAMYGSPRGSAIFMADLSKQYITSVVGGGGQGYKDGDGTRAQFNSISGIALSDDAKILYVSDLLNNVIRKVVIP